MLINTPEAMRFHKAWQMNANTRSTGVILATIPEKTGVWTYFGNDEVTLPRDVLRVPKLAANDFSLLAVSSG